MSRSKSSNRYFVIIDSKLKWKDEEHNDPYVDWTACVGMKDRDGREHWTDDDGIIYVGSFYTERAAQAAAEAKVRSLIKEDLMLDGMKSYKYEYDEYGSIPENVAADAPVCETCRDKHYISKSDDSYSSWTEPCPTCNPKGK